MNNTAKHDVKKAFICGGTGFLGFYAAKEFLKQGVEVGVMALPNEITLGQSWWPQEIKVHEGYLFNFRKMNKDLTEEEKKMNITHEEKVKMFTGYDTMVYAVGPDDRVHTPTNVGAYEFFYEKLVSEVVDTFEAAKEAGVKKAILLNSYFAYFNRVMPEKKLAENHPYIKVRTEQADACIKVGGGIANGGMDVISLELPYIFGSMPERTPLWKEVFLDRFDKMPAILFPKGGTNMIHVNGIAESVVASAYYGPHGAKLPVGSEDHKYKFMINLIMETIGSTKKYMGVPTWMATLGGYGVAKSLKKVGQDSGLNYKRLMKDIQAQDMFNAEDCAKTREILHYSEFGYDGGGSVAEGIINTAKACYPHRFDENGNLKPEFKGVNPCKAESATDNPVVNKGKKK